MNLVSDGGDHCAAGHWTEPDYQIVPISHWNQLEEDSEIPSEEALTFEAEELAIASRQGPKIWLEWHQQQVAPFDDAEFYALGPVVSVHYSDEKNEIWDEIIEVWSGEQADWRQEDETGRIIQSLHDPEEFRKQFPDGKLPDYHKKDGWTIIRGGRFVLSSFSASVDNDIFYSLTNAVEYAKDTLRLYAPTHS
jgi:hypothetical protein